MDANPGVRNLTDRFRQNARAVAESADQVGEHPARRNVHEMRIAIRRVRSLIWLFDRSEAPIGLKRFDRKLKRLGQRLGEVRELDVAIKDARELSLSRSKLKKQRKRSRRKITRHLTSKSVNHLNRLIEKAVEHIENAPNGPADQGLLCLFAELKRWQSKSIDRKSKMHKFRIATKRTRYIFEALGIDSELLTALQKTLGRLHDLEALRKLTHIHELSQKEYVRLRHRAAQEKDKVLPEALRRLSSFILVFNQASEENFKH